MLDQNERELVRLFGAYVEYCCTDIDQEELEDQSIVVRLPKPIYQYSYIDFKNYLKENNNVIVLTNFRYDDEPDKGHLVIMNIDKIKVSFFEYVDESKKISHELIFKNVNEMADWLRDQWMDEIHENSDKGNK